MNWLAGMVALIEPEMRALYFSQLSDVVFENALKSE